MAPEIVHVNSICTNQYSFSICLCRMFIPFTLNLSEDHMGVKLSFPSPDSISLPSLPFSLIISE